MNDGKLKRILKSKITIGVVCFMIGGSMLSDADKVKKLEEEIIKSEQSIETLSKESETQLSTIESKNSEIEELKAKIDSASPWFDMSEEEREVEKERILQAKAQKEKEEEERIAKEQAQKEEERKAAEQNTGNNTTSSTAAPTSTTAVELSQQNEGSGLVISVTGKKYHVAGCRTVKQVKQQVTASEAQSMGYTACKVCNP